MKNVIPFFLVIFLFACSKEEIPRFQEVGHDVGIEFSNTLSYTEEFNPYTYRNFFNGAGVALGDINNDGLLDVFFTGNIVDNKLFLNKGNWQFEDITAKAGVACPDVWSSGATFADVNGDGLLDLYVCKSGKPEGVNRHNELFINNGNLTFSEQSKKYGLDVTGLSTHAAFFDYDKDGDLDCYVLTNSIRSIGGFDLIEGQREKPDEDGGGNKLFRNDDGQFVDVTLELGIYSSKIGFGLGITLSDFNKDGWTDIFISNDFFERDYLYLNQEGKKFKESLETYFKSIAMGSMGADAADLDNDQDPDLFVTEMLPSTVERRRTKAVFESWDKYQLNVSNGYFHQFPRNVLQHNVGDSLFVEVGRFSGVSATDWSWGALIFDADNDGFKDLFVSNGIYKDLLDRDYLTYMANDQKVKQLLDQKGAVIKELIDIMPSQAITNQIFRNKGEFVFENASEEWGIKATSFSNGSAYGDLDNDGDLDLVVSNVNMPSFVFKNNTDTTTSRSIQVKLEGSLQNSYGVGAKILAYSGDQTYMIENFPFRGFQSSVDPLVHIGVGSASKLDSVVVLWERGGVSRTYDVPTNQIIIIKEQEAKNQVRPKNFILSAIRPSSISTEFRHIENGFNDFDRDRLLPHMLHNEGPKLALGDVDGDGIQEVFVGGAKEQPGQLLKLVDGKLVPYHSEFIEEDSISEDSQALFFDCDGDGDQDLYVASGGRAFSKSSGALRDRLYINDGTGKFKKDKSRLPYTENISSSSVTTLDFDSDGDSDLFITERFHPFRYGQKAKAFLLENDGQGYFKDESTTWIPTLGETYMMTDSKAADINGDGKDDLIIATDWGPIQIFINDGKQFNDETAKYGLDQYTGWWHALVVDDIDGDGDLDIIGGNHGLNSFFKDTTRLYVHDFDKNGTYDYIFCQKIGNKYYPVADKNELIGQLPFLKKKLLYFKDYANMTINDIFTKDNLSEAMVWESNTKATTLFLNDNTVFRAEKLNTKTQYAPVYAAVFANIDSDPEAEVILGGNQFLVKPQFGRYDALPLTVLDNYSKKFEVSQVSSITQVRDIKVLHIGEKHYIIVANNNDKLMIYEKN
ncbi:MAG: VCBS repeat-containing protein [Marinoscillum sp.]